jgi:hypothetical protein
MGARGMLAGLLGALAVAGWIYLGSEPTPGLARPLGPGPGPAAQGRQGSLDPEPYRSEIAALEALLYRDRPAELGDADRVSALAADLGERLQERERGLAGRLAFQRLLAFSGEVGAQGDAGYAAPDMTRPRAAWETLRGEVFAPAPWMRVASPLRAERQRRAEPTTTPDALAGLRAWGERISALAADVRPELLAFGEQYVDAGEGSAAERRLASDWNRFARRFDARVQEVARQAPPEPAWDGEPHVRSAYQQLGQALQRLRMATVAPGELLLPDKTWRREHLDGAAALVEAAGRDLAAARVGELRTAF